MQDFFCSVELVIVEKNGGSFMVQRTSGRGRSSRIKPDHTRMYIIIGIIAVAVVITTLVLCYMPQRQRLRRA